MSVLREASKKDWGLRGSNATEGELKLGCLQRIADACEKMAQSRTQLEGELKRTSESMDYWCKEAGRMARSNRSLRGVITRIKKSKA